VRATVSGGSSGGGAIRTTPSSARTKSTGESGGASDGRAPAIAVA